MKLSYNYNLVVIFQKRIILNTINVTELFHATKIAVFIRKKVVA